MSLAPELRFWLSTFVAYSQCFKSPHVCLTWGVTCRSGNDGQRVYTEYTCGPKSRMAWISNDNKQHSVMYDLSVPYIHLIWNMDCKMRDKMTFKNVSHYSGVIMGAMASQITSVVRCGICQIGLLYRFIIIFLFLRRLWDLYRVYQSWRMYRYGSYFLSNPPVLLQSRLVWAILWERYARSRFLSCTKNFLLKDLNLDWYVQCRIVPLKCRLSNN